MRIICAVPDADPRDARIAELERENAELRMANERLAIRADEDLRRLSTEHQRIAEQLRRSHDTFFHLIQNHPFGLFVVDADLRMRQVSRGAQKTFVNVVPLIGRDFAQVLHVVWPEPIAGDVLERFRHALATGEPYVGTRTVERRADTGEVAAFDWHIERIELPDGSSGVACYFYDLSERERWESALRERERELQMLADNIPDILTRYDRELRHVFINAAIEAVTGRRPEEFLGKTNRDLGMPASLCDQWDAAILATFEHRRPERIEFTFDSIDGPRSYAARFVPEIGPGGEVDHVLAAAHDVTDIKRAEAALRDADRRKDEFLAILAHELRNQLAPVRNGLALLRQGRVAEETSARALVVMERQLGHLVRLVDDLLDVSRIGRGAMELERERLPVRTIVEHAVETSRPLVMAASHTLVVELPDAPVWVLGDLTRLTQVIGNLLNNAAKYTPRGGRIVLSAAVEGDEVVIRVTDDGIGIAPELLHRVFDLFAQVEDALDRSQGGLGIGLALVRKLLELHGGTIEAQSPGRGHGSTFIVRLPLAPALPEVVPALPEAEAPALSASRRVLVVDDNADAAETIAMLLEVSGHETKVAGSGPEALDIARTWQPEVVFLDIGLPGMDGYEVARRMRDQASTVGAMLVALTGWGSDDMKAESKEAGFDLHLVKPVGPEVVANAVARATRSKAPG